MSQSNGSTMTGPATAAVRDPIDSSAVPVIVVVTMATGLVLQLVGAATNFLNTLVFFRVGLRDAVSLSFFALSASDFVYMVCNGLGTNGFHLVDIVFPGKPWARDLATFGDFFIWYTVSFKDYTLVVSTFIAVARCCLVTLPFHFKSVFSLHRTLASLLIIFILTVAIHMPMLFTQGLKFAFDSKANITRLVAWQNVYRKDTLAFHDLLVRNIVPYVCLATIAVCIAILASTLASASRFRKSMSEFHVGSTLKLESSGGDLSTRDIRVIKAVCFISGSYFLGFLPTALQSIFRLIFPDFNLGRTYQNTFVLVLAIAVTVSQISSAINILFYVLFNTKFRDEFRGLRLRKRTCCSLTKQH